MAARVWCDDFSFILNQINKSVSNTTLTPKQCREFDDDLLHILISFEVFSVLCLMPRSDRLGGEAC